MYFGWLLKKMNFVLYVVLLATTVGVVRCRSLRTRIPLGALLTWHILHCHAFGKACVAAFQGSPAGCWKKLNFNSPMVCAATLGVWDTDAFARRKARVHPFGKLASLSSSLSSHLIFYVIFILIRHILVEISPWIGRPWWLLLQWLLPSTFLTKI